MTLAGNQAKTFTTGVQRWLITPSKVICDFSSKVSKNEEKENKDRKKEIEKQGNKSFQVETEGKQGTEVSLHDIIELPSYKGSALKLQAFQRESCR